MKKIKLVYILFICLLFVINVKFLLGYEWSGAIRISSGSTPDLDVDPTTGYLHIVTMGSNGVTYTKMMGDGTILIQEQVPGAESDRGGSNLEHRYRLIQQGILMYVTVFCKMMIFMMAIILTELLIDGTHRLNFLTISQEDTYFE